MAPFCPPLLMYHLSHRIKERNDALKLQANIQNIFRWAQINNNKFNKEKFEPLRPGPNTELKDCTKIYSVDKKKLTRAASSSVLVSTQTPPPPSSTTPRTHSAKPGGWSPGFSKPLRPVLDHCRQVWSPHKKGDTQELESAQSFTTTTQGMTGRRRRERCGATCVENFGVAGG